MKECRKSFQTPLYKIKIALLECELQAFENIHERVGVEYSTPSHLEGW